MSKDSSAIRSTTLKEKARIAILPLILTAFIGNIFYQNHLHHLEKVAKIARYKVAVAEYLEYGKTCTSFSSLPEINYENNTRSNQRWESVLAHYVPIRVAKCFTDKDKTVFRNPYLNLSFTNIAEASPGTAQYEYWQGMLYDFDMGMPFLRTGGSVCGDGSFSPSVGRGTCSWHGGYGNKRGERFDFKLAQKIHDPRPYLARLQAK